MKIVINRLAQQNDKQTLGDLYLFDGFGQVLFECRTLELPWRDNKRNVSCIPPGIGGGEKSYPFVLLDNSPSFPYRHIWIKNVPDRSGIKIHRGNYYTQIMGCPLVGDKFIDLNEDGLLDVANSTRTLTDLIFIMDEILKEDEGEIVIKGAAS